MNMPVPDVSVIMPTYNHASFVEEAMRSVLSQEGVDLEFIIADDGSTDATAEVIARVPDARIRFFPNAVNRGAPIVTNELIGRARGKYIALINSDDAWTPGKLKYQLDYLEANPKVGATFGRARFIDRDGAPVAKESLPFGTVFDQENRSAGQWLRRFFAEGNCICHPTMLIRSEVYRELGTYSNRLRQLPDMDMWIRLVKKYELHVSERELIDFRMLPGESASSQTHGNTVRTLNEHYLIAETLLDGASRELLIDGFGDILVFKEVASDEHLEIEKTLLYFHENQWLWRPYKLVGLRRMRRLLDSDAHRKVLADAYGVDDRWFQAEMARIDVLMPPPPPPPPPLVHTVRGGIRYHAEELWRAACRRLRRSLPS